MADNTGRYELYEEYRGVAGNPKVMRATLRRATPAAPGSVVVDRVEGYLYDDDGEVRRTIVAIQDETREYTREEWKALKATVIPSYFSWESEKIEKEAVQVEGDSGSGNIAGAAPGKTGAAKATGTAKKASGNVSVTADANTKTTSPSPNTTIVPGGAAGTEASTSAAEPGSTTRK